MFSILSWNVEHFRGDEPRRLKDVADHVRGQSADGKGPDVFALFEIKRDEVRGLVEQQFPEHDFALTDGPQVQEILVGWRRGRFQQAVFAQKREFKAYNPWLRPGALLTVRRAGAATTFLFLHTDSGTEARDFGNRYEMFEHIWKLKNALARQAGGPVRMAILGDFNTMGLHYPYRRVANYIVRADDEIEALGEYGRRRDMRLLGKSHDATWTNGDMVSNLDHVLATDNMTFRALQTDGAANAQHEARVSGWVDRTGQARTRFVDKVSDHCSLYAEVD